MSGHSKWSQIKHKKASVDAKKSTVFSKLAQAISLASREKGPDPALNPTLRTLIEKARAANIPKDTIERAVKKGADKEGLLAEVIYEAYAPGGVAVVIVGITDNNNRTFSEVRTILGTHNAKMAPGGALWAFTKHPDGSYSPATIVETSETTRAHIEELTEALTDHPDVQEVYTNMGIQA